MICGIQKERSKRHHHKTRTGCSTCKRRHFKCDEKKPSCLRCILAGKECEYKVPQPKTFPPTPQESRLSSPRSVESFVGSDPRERRALLFFKERTGPSLTGFTSYTEIFWVSLIPQLCQSEVAVRHIVIALSTKHEVMLSGSENSVDKTLFLTRHHSLALNALTQQHTPPNTEILLVSCIAFIAFERLQDRTGLDGRYLNYVIAGLKILRERSAILPPHKPDAFNLVDSFIEPMFFQIELLFSMFCQPDRLISCRAQQYQLPSPDIPAVFQNLESAREIFFQICVWRYTLSHGGRKWSSTSAAFLEIKSLLSRWQDSLSSYIATLSEDMSKERSRVYALRQQTQLLVGTMLYSVREDVPENCCTRPVLVDLSIPGKILIFVQIQDGRKINLAGINSGRPSGLKDSGLWLWPHAKRISVQGGDALISLEFSQSLG